MINNKNFKILHFIYIIIKQYNNKLNYIFNNNNSNNCKSFYKIIIIIIIVIIAKVFIK